MAKKRRPSSKPITTPKRMTRGLAADFRRVIKQADKLLREMAVLRDWVEDALQIRAIIKASHLRAGAKNKAPGKLPESLIVHLPHLPCQTHY